MAIAGKAGRQPASGNAADERGSQARAGENLPGVPRHRAAVHERLSRAEVRARRSRIQAVQPLPNPAGNRGPQTGR
jgi:hypothetical protein